MSLVTTPAYGPYTATYKSVALGLVEGPYVINKQAHAVDVRAQRHGQTIIEGIYAGGEAHVLVTPKEWNAAAREAMWPFDANFGELGVIGRLMSAIALALVITPVTGSTGATNGYTWTFSKAIIAPEHSLEIVKGVEEHNVAVLMKAYPYLNTANPAVPVWFTVA